MKYKQNIQLASYTLNYPTVTLDDCPIRLFLMKVYVLLECLNIWVSVISTHFMRTLPYGGKF